MPRVCKECSILNLNHTEGLPLSLPTQQPGAKQNGKGMELFPWFTGLSLLGTDGPRLEALGFPWIGILPPLSPAAATAFALCPAQSGSTWGAEEAALEATPNSSCLWQTTEKSSKRLASLQSNTVSRSGSPTSRTWEWNTYF